VRIHSRLKKRMIPWRAGPADFIDDANAGCTPVQHQQRVAPCQPGSASSKFIRYRIASSLSRRMRARRLRSCLPAPSKRRCSKKHVRPKRRCASTIGPTHPACSRRSESAALRASVHRLSAAANVVLLHHLLLNKKRGGRLGRLLHHCFRNDGLERFRAKWESVRIAIKFTQIA
jgi:hypothetical protein